MPVRCRGSQAADGAGLESRWSTRSSGVRISPSALSNLCRRAGDSKTRRTSVPYVHGPPRQKKSGGFFSVSPSAHSTLCRRGVRFENPDDLRERKSSLPHRTRCARSMRSPLIVHQFFRRRELDSYRLVVSRSPASILPMTSQYENSLRTPCNPDSCHSPPGFLGHSPTGRYA